MIDGVSESCSEVIDALLEYFFGQAVLGVELICQCEGLFEGLLMVGEASLKRCDDALQGSFVDIARTGSLC